MTRNINGTPLNEKGRKAYKNGHFFETEYGKVYTQENERMGVGKYSQMPNFLNPRSWNEYKSKKALSNQPGAAAYLQQEGTSASMAMNDPKRPMRRGGRSRRVRKTRHARRTRRSRKH